MRLRWTPAAAADLEHIHDYLTEHHPRFARSTVEKIYEGIRSLKASPRLGRVGREEDTRELVFARFPCIAVYRLKHQSIEGLRIYHGAQQRP